MNLLFLARRYDFAEAVGRSVLVAITFIVVGFCYVYFKRRSGKH